ncbi:MAG TPA: PilZ domain-containing protein [bacterium]|nr:PilZ domain-containing protein [bacterium]
MEPRKEYSGEERRRYVRIPYEAVIRYKACKKDSVKKGNCDDDHHPKGKHGYASAGAKNLSTGGVLLATKQLYPLDTILMIEMDVPSMDGYSTVTIWGKIVHTGKLKNGGGYDNGISFYKIKDEDRKAIQDFLEFCPTADEPDAGLPE